MIDWWCYTATWCKGKENYSLLQVFSLLLTQQSSGDRNTDSSAPDCQDNTKKWA